MLEDSQSPQASWQLNHAAVGVRVKTEVYKNKQCEQLASECFFLEDRSRVVSYKLSTKFLRHGTFTSFFTAYMTRQSLQTLFSYLNMILYNAINIYWGK